MMDALGTLDATLLSRIQFGFTISFHIVFPALSIGLAGFLPSPFANPPSLCRRNTTSSFHQARSSA